VKALRAAPTARSTSCATARATSAMRSPVAGLVTAMRSPVEPVVHSPSMKLRQSVFMSMIEIVA
jgi:hypothetical protein